MRRHLRQRKALQVARACRPQWAHIMVPIREYIAAMRGRQRHAKRQAEIDARKRVAFLHTTWDPALAARAERELGAPLLSGEIGRIDNFRIVTS